MTLEVLEKARDNARLASNKEELVVLNDMIAFVRKAETSGKKRVELTEQMINDALIKYRKSVKESIATCPEGHRLMETYLHQLKIVENFCPKVVDNVDVISAMIKSTLEESGIVVNKKAKGQMMKALMPVFKANYVDTDIAMPLIDELIKNS